MRTDCYTVILQCEGNIEEITSYESSDKAVEDVKILLECRFYEFKYTKDYIKEHTLTHKQKLTLEDGYSILILKSKYVDMFSY